MAKDPMYDMTDKEVEPFWKLKPDSDLNSMIVILQFEAQRQKIKMSVLCEKWKAYLEMCAKQERDSKYVKGFKNFIDHKVYLQDFAYFDKPGSVAKQWLEGLPQ